MNHQWRFSENVYRVLGRIVGLRSERVNQVSLMVLKCFSDDSTCQNSDDQVGILSGVVLDLPSAKELVLDWERLLPTHGVLSAQNIYHFKLAEMLANQERRARVPAFVDVINRCCALTVSVGLKRNEYFKALNTFERDNAEKVSVQYGSNPFHLLFLGLHQGLSLKQLRPFEIIGQKPIDEWIIDQSAEAKIVDREWESYSRLFTEEERQLFRARPIFRDDKDYLPIQAADLIAGSVREWVRSGVDFRDASQLVVCGKQLTTPHLHYWYSEEAILDCLNDLISDR